MLRRFCGWTLLITSVCLATTEAQATKFWKNSVTSGNWGTGNNWSAVSAAGTDNSGTPIVLEPTNIVTTSGVARTVTLDVNTPTLGLLSLDLTGAGSAANTLNIASNVSLTAGAGFGIGGYNGTAFTNGRGAVNQSAGNVTVSPGVDLILAWGAGSSGAYTLSGGSLATTQSQWVGFAGTGVFNHTAGTNTLNPSGLGFLSVGNNTGASGTYNLQGSAATLTSHHDEYVGFAGTGVFNHSAGTNTIVGSKNLFLGSDPTGNGTYNLTGGTLTVGNNVTVGGAGVGARTIGAGGNAFVNNTLAIGPQGTVNLHGGELRLNNYSRVPTGALNYSSGTVRFAGARELRSDPSVAAFFPTGVVPAGKKLAVDSNAFPEVLIVDGGELETQGFAFLGWNGDGEALIVQNGGHARTVFGAVLGASFDRSGSATVTGGGSSWDTGNLLYLGDQWNGSLAVNSGGAVTSFVAVVGSDSVGTSSSAIGLATVTGEGSRWDVDQSLQIGTVRSGFVSVTNQATLDVANELVIGANGVLKLAGGLVRINTYQRNPGGQFDFQSGTVALIGDRTVGADPAVAEIFGVSPVVPLGKGLIVEGTATVTTPLRLNRGTFKANSLVIGTGGSLDFDRGVLEINGGVVQGVPQLVVPADGEFRANGTPSVRVVGTTGSTVTATGNLFLGDNTAVNGFATQGTLHVGANLVSLLDANDAVLDSTSFTTLGEEGNPGTLDSFYGITLNFGGNITGYGTISTLGDITTPLINNGHITGVSQDQRITLPGYVKGVGTFDNVTFTGTFAPGLSPTSLVVGSVGLSNTSTLLIEVGGTSPGGGYDQILSSGSLTLDGTLQLSLINGFSPTAGQSFNLFDWTSVSGAFDSLVLPALAGDLTWDTTQLYTRGVLGVVNGGLPGDYNADGLVNAADYTVWRDTLGSTTSLAADGDSSGTIDDADRAVWASNYGAVAPSTANAVPEPSAGVVGALAVAAYSAAIRRRTSA